MKHITFTIFLNLILIGLLAQCASAPRQPASSPPAAGPAPFATSSSPSAARPLPTAPAPLPLVHGTPSGLVPAAEAPPPPAQQPQPFKHEVRWSGETLSHIASWYTGSGSNWEKIAKANPGLKPLRINIGDKILIPEELVKIRKPMPPDYVKSLAAPTKPSSTRSVPPLKDTGKAELFGPVEVSPPPRASEKTELYGPVEAE
jgi:hypothetical protein